MARWDFGKWGDRDVGYGRVFSMHLYKFGYLEYAIG